MKNKLLIFITLILAATLCFAACSNRANNGDGTASDGIKSIEVVEGTIPAQVNLGAKPDFSGIKVKVIYEDGTDKTVGVADGVKVSALDTMTVGAKTVTVTYGDFSVKVQIIVVDPDATAYVTSIKIVPGSLDEKYHLGQTPDMSRFQVEATYNTGKVDALSGDAYTFTAIDTASEGKKTFTVTLNANPELTASFEYEVIGITDMKVMTGSVAKKINVGQTLDTSALEISVEFVDGKNIIVPVTSLTVGTIDTTTPGVQNLAITYAGVTIQYPVEVVGAVSLTVNQGSYNAKVKVFETYTAPSIAALVKYSDGTEKTLGASELTLSAVDTSTVGTKNLVVSHAGLEVTLEITVVGVETMTFVDDTVKFEILKGQAFNTSGIGVNVKYTDGTTDVIYAGSLTIEGVDANTAGEQTLRVTYLNATVEHKVKVCAITSIRVEGVNRVLQVGQPIILDNMKVYGVYNDSAETEILLTDGITTNKDSLDLNSREKTLVISYNGEHGSFSSNVLISSAALELSDIEIRNWQKAVVLGGTFDKNSVTVYAIYGDGSAEKVTNYTITNIATNVAGTVKFTVTYTENGTTKTAEASVKVLPVAAIEVVDSSVPSVVNKGAALDTSKIKVTVIYSDGVDTIRRIVHANVVSISTPDTSSKGDKTFKVTYLGKETEVSYHVREVASISILAGSVDSDLRAGYSVDYSGLYLNIVYSNGDREQVKASTLMGVTYSGTGVNSTTFGVTYEGCSASMGLTIIKVKGISALNNTVPALVLQGTVVDYSKMMLTVTYHNGDVYLVPFTDSHLKVTPDVFDTSKPGTYSITFVYNDGISSFEYEIAGHKLTSFNFETSVNIIVRGISKVEVVSGVFNKTYVGKRVDTSGISVKVTYDDGTYIYVNRNNPGLIVGTVDTSKVGTSKLVVEFSGVKGYMDISVEEAPTVNGLIFGALLPDELVARESYKNNYKDGTSEYRVGDDNPYYFYLNVIQLDENDNVVDIDGKTIPTVSTIYMDGAKTPLTTEELAKYVVFDSFNNSYDFTEAAIGHKFRIVIRPADETSYIDEASVTKEHTVTVVDGYNIYNAWELNIMTNTDVDITEQCFGSAGIINQREVVTKFLSKKGVTRPDNLAGVVLHCNLDIKVEDLPSEYFYIDENGVNQGFYDHLGVFNIALDEVQRTFSIYGNYYTIYSYNLPCVVPNGVANNGDDYSSSELFKIKARFDYVPEREGISETKGYVNVIPGNGDALVNTYTSNIVDLATRDNDPNSNDQTASARHMRGLICYKVGESTTNMTNVNIDAYMTSLCVEHSNSTLNLDKVKFYNAWQGHLLLWNHNRYQDWTLNSLDTDPSMRNLVVNIEDSLLAKSGGPVILAQHAEMKEAVNKGLGIDVRVDHKSEIYSYVTGQEAWFVAVGQVQLATQIKTMSALISGFGGPHGYTSSDKIQGNETINMIMVNMGEGLSINGQETYNGSFTRVNADGSETVSLMMRRPDNNRPGTFINPMLEMYLAATGGKPPIFQNNMGGIAYTDGESGCYGLETGAPGAPTPNFYQGDTMTLYYMGVGILMEYYHK